MKLTVGPTDLNIPVGCLDHHTSVKDLVRRALALGYQSIALNTEIHQEELLAKRKQQQGIRKDQAKKSKSGEKPKAKTNENCKATLDYFPAPVLVNLTESDYPDLAAKGRKPIILNRLTITVTNNDFIIDYRNSEQVKKYNILAINPTSSQTLLALLKSSFRFDIITFNPDKLKDGIRWSRKLYYECVENHVFFEIMYAPAIRDSTDRRRIISQSHNYHSVGRSKNIFFSSHAKSPIQLRSPADVANLAFVFGLSEDQGKSAINATCHAVSRAAAGRKMGPFRVRIEKVGDVDPGKVPESDSEDEEESEASESAEEEGSLLAEPTSWQIDTASDSTEQAMELK